MTRRAIRYALSAFAAATLLGAFASSKVSASELQSPSVSSWMPCKPCIGGPPRPAGATPAAFASTPSFSIQTLSQGSARKSRA
jgi:hypothetical protein